MPCETMQAHPMHTLKIHQLCRPCVAKRRRTTGIAAKLKDAMRDLGETVQRLKAGKIEVGVSSGSESAGSVK